MKIAMGSRKEILDMYGEETRKFLEAKVIYDQLKEDLDMQIGLSIGVGGLGDKSESWRKDKEL